VTRKKKKDNNIGVKTGDNAFDVSLTQLMNVLLAFDTSTPCYMHTRTVPDMVKRCQTTGKTNPYMGNATKVCKSLVRINDDYESAVIRRQLYEAAIEGRNLAEDEMFVADHPKWGEKLKGMAPLFEWWIPQNSGEVTFYIAVRPIQRLETWFEWIDNPGIRMSPAHQLELEEHFLRTRDEVMDAMRQDVESPVLWRKYKFTSIVEMTLAGIRYRVTDNRQPDCPKVMFTRLRAEFMKKHPDLAGVSRKVTIQ
jgi:hypothetical protein